MKGSAEIIFDGVHFPTLDPSTFVKEQSTASYFMSISMVQEYPEVNSETGMTETWKETFIIDKLDTHWQNL